MVDRRSKPIPVYSCVDREVSTWKDHLRQVASRNIFIPNPLNCASYERPGQKPPPSIGFRCWCSCRVPSLRRNRGTRRWSYSSVPRRSVRHLQSGAGLLLDLRASETQVPIFKLTSN